VGLLDVMPSPVIQQLPGPAPASTVSWTAHFVAPDAGAPGDWNYFAYESVAAGDGYCIATGRLYDEAGRLVGWQEQLQAIFG
jgi:acyl-CoA thioesterase